MSAKDKIKKGLGMAGTALVGLGMAAWYLIRIPPRTVNWVLKNKMKTLALVALGYIGYGKLQEKFASDEDQNDPGIEFVEDGDGIREQGNDDTTQGLDPRTAQVDNTSSNTPAQNVQTPADNQPVRKSATPNPMQAATGQVLTQAPKTEQPAARPTEDVKLDAEAEAAVLANTFISSPTADMVNMTGDRALPVGDRLQHFVETRSKGTQEPERSGIHTLLICSQDNPKNFVALHVGFHLDPELEDIREYRLYEGLVKSQEGHVPMVGVFNINFPEVPGMRMGIEVDQDGARLTDFREGAQTLNVRKDKGRSLLMVDSQGNVNRVFDQSIMDATYGKVDLKQSGGVKNSEWTAHMDQGWDQPLQKQQVPTPSKLSGR